MSLQQSTRFDPSAAEPRLTDRWLKAGIFSPAAEGRAEDNYSIAIPPPNVTGALHMGHALNGTIQDTLARLRRQQGRRVRWTVGTDHAGIATQTQVERRLKALGSSREEVGRERFIAETWAWREQFGDQIIKQFQRLGCSCDYSDERFTLDEGYARAVLDVFVTLYRKGFIYRDYYMVNWDPGSGSTISDLEVEDREVEDTLYYVAYPLTDGSGELVVATVRPETMGADVAVAVNPDDDRYRGYVGKTVRLPLTERELPVIADAYVKTDFGTGALKITPGHDLNDFEIGRRHNLPELSVIGEDGLIGAEHGGIYAGMKVAEAQRQIVVDLDAQGYLRRSEPYLHTVPFSHRSGERIEPLISLQWFMRMDELAAPAIAAVREGRVKIHPESQSRRYLEWLEGIRPWALSRQLWWGHQIPVWYRGEEGSEETYVGANAPSGEGWRRDEDVLDTWFSSALWPFATLGWPEQTPQLKAFYPTDVLSTARDILFLWVARMVMMGLQFTDDIPFKDVYCHAVIQAPDGRRMSKSLGTGIDPLALIEGGERPPVFATDGRKAGEFPAYGADAVRFGLLAMESSQDVRFSEDRIAQGAALVTKLYNATRFMLLNTGERAPTPQPSGRRLEDRWIASRLLAARRERDEQIDRFDFSKAAFGLYDVVFGQLCDWYIELIKGRDIDDELAAHLIWVLRETLVLAHPLLPFVTEELWEHLPASAAGDELLAATVSPPPSAALSDPTAEAQVGSVIAAVQAVRSWRDVNAVKPSERVEARISGFDDGELIDAIVRLGRLTVIGDDDRREPLAILKVGAGKIEPMTGVDRAALAAKAALRQAEIEREIARAEGKLANKGFIAKAPERVVTAEREKLQRLRDELTALELR